MVGFLNTLCGPNASNLKVKDMSRYAFDPTQLVLQISSVLVQAWEHDGAKGKEEGFAECLAMHPDLSMATMKKCVSVLRNSSIGEVMLAKFLQLLDKVSARVLMRVPKRVLESCPEESAREVS